MLVEGLERPTHRTLFLQEGALCSQYEESRESRKILGQWVWRVWRGWERFQSLGRSARMVTGEGAQLSGWEPCWGWVSQHRAEAGSGEGGGTAFNSHSARSPVQPQGGGGQTLSLGQSTWAGLGQGQSPPAPRQT